MEKKKNVILGVYLDARKPSIEEILTLMEVEKP